MTDVLIACRDVAVGYDGAAVLAGVNLEIRRGEIVALLGGSGCGKSTLLRAMNGLLPPLAGEVIVLGESLYALSPDARAALLRRTGTALQQDGLFGAMTVADNVGLPLRDRGDVPAAVIAEMVRMRLALVGLDGLGPRQPATLSGGQRKRAALARATIHDPALIFCDEPSAGLDPAIAASIDEALLALRALLGATMVVVTHELASIEAIADRAIMFGDGGIVAAGTIDELAVSPAALVHGFFHRVASPTSPGHNGHAQAIPPTQPEPMELS
jgi:phospholipid/cholesterol/gamma-HCH transport system ATP-binding protein